MLHYGKNVNQKEDRVIRSSSLLNRRIRGADCKALNMSAKHVGKNPEADFFSTRASRAQVVALRARIPRFALLPANPPVLQATGDQRQVIGCWEQVVGIKEIKLRAQVRVSVNFC